MSFAIFQKGKTTFQAIKTKSSKSRNIDVFPKGLTHGFCLKTVNFPTFFLGQVVIFYDILVRKNAFLGYQNKKFKSRKTDIIPKGLTHGFGPEMAIFPTFFFFQAIQARKISFTIFYHEKTPFQAIKSRIFKIEKLTFLQTV